MRLASLAAFIAALLRQALAAPYLFANATDTTNTTLTTPSGGPYVCQYVYPSDLAVVNSRYPDYDVDHLHQAKSFFMLRRQILGEGEIATRVQFQGLPPQQSNITCRLEFVLPNEDLQKISGRNPTFNVYQVNREPNAIAT
ncbi:hypothetical protein SVAN01_07812 [Stagonosporopsis vannaccii]|nr:hypothetical protein SVAN01_07812 [Stagonosporopsis vannaccii]